MRTMPYERQSALLFLSAFAIIAVSLGCRREDRRNETTMIDSVPQSATKDGGTKGDQNGKIGSASERDAASTNDNTDEKAILSPRDEGKDRPMGTMTEEAVLPRPTFPKPLAGQMIAITGGTLLAGSAPQDRLRIQWAENDLVPHKITPFEMDVLPYPGDPDRVYLTGVTRSEAERLCTEEGKRLCTELEWEWACKSAELRRYPTGNRYDESAYPEGEIWRPASLFGVFAMGRILEWTASDWGGDEELGERYAARGYAIGLDEPPEQGRRCAQRWRRLKDSTHPQLGFRCCRGPINDAVVKLEKTRPPIRIYQTFDEAKFAATIRSIPELEALHDSPHMYGEGDERAVLARRRSDREELAKQGIHFTSKPIRWIPRQGTEFLVAVGSSNRHSFIVALYELEDKKRYAHASSLLLWNQLMPLALAYQEGNRDNLFWAPCWICRDGGKIEWDDEKNEVLITQKW